MMDSLPSFKSLLADIAPEVPVANPMHYHLSAAAGGASPFFSTSASSFFSSSSSSSTSSFFSSSGELSGLLGTRSPSSRPGKESPLTAPSSPCQPASLASILSSSRLTTTTTITHHHHTTLAAPPPALPSNTGGRVISPGHQQLLPLAPSSPESMFPAGVRPPPVSGSPGVALEQARKDLLARKTSLATPLVRVCTMCGTTKTKQWRSGSDGRPSLCNACGLRYRKDSLGQKFKFKQVVIFPSGYPTKKRKAANKAREDKDKVDSVDEKEITASLSAAKARSPKRQRSSPVDTEQPAESSSDQKKSSIYALLN